MTCTDTLRVVFAVVASSIATGCAVPTVADPPAAFASAPTYLAPMPPTIVQLSAKNISPNPYFGYSALYAGTIYLNLGINTVGPTKETGQFLERQTRSDVSIFTADIPSVLQSVAPTIQRLPSTPPLARIEITPAVLLYFQTNNVFSFSCMLHVAAIQGGAIQWTSRYLVQSDQPHTYRRDSGFLPVYNLALTACFSKATELFERQRRGSMGPWVRASVQNIYGAKLVALPTLKSELPSRIIQKDSAGLYEYSREHVATLRIED